jgi:tetratricopeptide (TPR) repeat protein
VKALQAKCQTFESRSSGLCSPFFVKQTFNFFFGQTRSDPRDHTNQHENTLSVFSCDFVDRIIFLVVFVLVVCVAPAFAQRPTARRPASHSSRASDNGGPLSNAARAALDAAVANLQNDKLPEAERSARAAVAAAPRSALTHNVLGVVLDRQGRSDEALSQFNTAITLDPNFVSARNNLGRMLAARGKKVEATAQFEQVLKSDPAHLQAHYNLGALYADAADYSKAADHFARARAAAPDDPQLALAFLNVAFRANRATEAALAVDQVERLYGSDVRGLFTLASVLAQNQQYERAAALFGRVNMAQPHTYEVLYNLGVALYNLDRNDEAAKYLAEAADINPAPAETHMRLGLIATARKDHANAVEEYRHAIERDQKNATYHYMLGREYFDVAFWEGAINEYERAIALDPKQVAYVMALGNANFRKNEWAPAAAAFDLAATIDPKIENIDYLRGYAHRAAGNFDQARELLERFVSQQPDHVDALASLGYVAIEQGRLDEAATPLARALKLDPQNVPVLYDYARLAVKRRDYAEAAVRLQKVLNLAPGHGQAHYQLFLSYSRLKQTDKAQTELAEFKRLEALEKQVRQERNLDERLRTQQMLGQKSQ